MVPSSKKKSSSFGRQMFHDDDYSFHKCLLADKHLGLVRSMEYLGCLYQSPIPFILLGSYLYLILLAMLDV